MMDKKNESSITKMENPVREAMRTLSKVVNLGVDVDQRVANDIAIRDTLRPLAEEWDRMALAADPRGYCNEVAHVCRGPNVVRVRPYPRVWCSLCMTHHPSKPLSVADLTEHYPANAGTEDAEG